MIIATFFLSVSEKKRYTNAYNIQWFLTSQKLIFHFSEILIEITNYHSLINWNYLIGKILAKLK